MRDDDIADNVDDHENDDVIDNGDSDDDNEHANAEDEGDEENEREATHTDTYTHAHPPVDAADVKFAALFDNPIYA